MVYRFLVQRPSFAREWGGRVVSKIMFFVVLLGFPMFSEACLPPSENMLFHFLVPSMFYGPMLLKHGETKIFETTGWFSFEIHGHYSFYWFFSMFSFVRMLAINIGKPTFLQGGTSQKATPIFPMFSPSAFQSRLVLQGHSQKTLVSQCSVGPGSHH